jgi:hypothetical protein
VKALLATAALVAALGLVGNADLEEAQRHADQYCQFVADGTWPPYNPDINCEDRV